MASAIFVIFASLFPKGFSNPGGRMKSEPGERSGHELLPDGNSSRTSRA